VQQSLSAFSACMHAMRLHLHVVAQSGHNPGVSIRHLNQNHQGCHSKALEAPGACMQMRIWEGAPSLKGNQPGRVQQQVAGVGPSVRL
jgi:hypothetical protein